MLFVQAVTECVSRKKNLEKASLENNQNIKFLSEFLSKNRTFDPQYGFLREIRKMFLEDI